MNRLIGITGGMSSGKTTLAKELLKLNDYTYVDVDEYRRSLYKNDSYVKELKKIIKELKDYKEIDSIILNKIIYTNEEYMMKYKDLLYKYLFNYLDSLEGTILVDWALILNDNLQDRFNKIIYLDIDEDTRLKRLTNSDLSREEILKRFELQRIDLNKYKSSNLLIIKDIDINKINDFINAMECKFTIPNDGGKVIWEITHNCNYGCSYCIFSCTKKRVEGELSTEECFHVIDELVRNGFKHLKVTGGEPFIRKDIIEILKYASKYMVVDISTNASLLSEDLVNKLNKINLKMIHVSLDGNKEEHDSVRGINTYERTIRGLEYLKKSKNKVRIGTVIHKNNEDDLEDIVKLSKEYGDEIIFSIMEPVEGQDKSLVKTRSNEELIENINSLKNKYKDVIVNCNFDSQPVFVKRCPGGDKFLYINNKGFVSPCTWVYEKNKNCISKISLRDHSLGEVLKDKDIGIFTSNKKEGICYGKI